MPRVGPLGVHREWTRGRPHGREIVHRRRRLGTVAATLLIVVQAVTAAPAAAVVPADAPGTCAGATTDSPLGTWIKDTIEPSGDVDWFRFTTTSGLRALITLGKLAADYRLDLYSSCGAVALASSNRSGVRYEELYRYLPTGTYFVKVSGVAGAHSPTQYHLRFRSLVESVQVPSYRTWVDGTRLFLVGELLNNTGETRRFVKAVLTFYDSENQPIGSAWYGYSHIDLMKPRTRSPFGPAYAPIPAGGYDHVTVAPDPGSVTDDVPIGNLTIKAGAPYDSLAYRHYPGTLTNSNAFALSSTNVVVTLYNDTGRVVNADYTYPGSLAAGASVAFDCLLSDHFSGVNRYVFQAQADE